MLYIVLTGNEKFEGVFNTDAKAQLLFNRLMMREDYVAIYKIDLSTQMKTLVTDFVA